MHKIKSHKTIEQIAKKHGVDVSFIEKQLKIGAPIEHEHTKDHDLAMDIALQHLGEIPDYYTRLRKMEISAKKKNVSEETVEGDDMDSPVKMRPVNAMHVEFEKRYCPRCKKVELRSECQYGPRYWDMFSLPEKLKEHCGCENSAVKELESGLKKLSNTSYDSIDKLMRRIMKKHDMTAKQLHNAFVDKHNKTPDDWIKQLEEEGLRAWFGKSKSKDGKSGWVNVVTGGTCASDEPGEGVPKCVSSAKRASMTPAERLSAARRKKAADPGQQQKTGAAKPTYVPTDNPKKKMKEEMDLQEVKDKPGKGSGKKDACYHKVKSRYSVWPSAYASGALVKCRKVGADNWGTKSEETIMEKDHEYSMIRSELSTIRNAVHRLQKKMKNGEGNVEAWVQSKITKAADYLDSAADYVDSGEHDVPENLTIEDAEGNTFAEIVDLILPDPIKIEEATRLQSQTGNVIVVTLMWRGKYYSMRMFFPQLRVPSRKEMNDELQKVYPGCKVVAHSVSEFTPGEPLIQACGPQGGSFAKPGPNKNYVKTMGEEVELEEDWQKVNRQDKTSGLSQKAVNAYRRENPGSKLQTAVTEKNPTGKRAERRKSFCRRMTGMKKRLTSAETARDPDSNINKALRRWNCN